MTFIDIDIYELCQLHYTHIAFGYPSFEFELGV